MEEPPAPRALRDRRKQLETKWRAETGAGAVRRVSCVVFGGRGHLNA